MKVITEEMIPLIEYQEDDKEFPFKNHGLSEILNKYLVEIDQLTVSKLRPMSEIESHDGLDILVFHIDTGRFVHAAHQNHMDGWFIYEFDCMLITTAHYNGWIPMPIYKTDQS